MAILLGCFVALGAFLASAVAFAQVPSGDDGGAIASAVLQAVTTHNYKLLAALVLMGGVWCVRKFAVKPGTFWASDRGGAALAVLGGLVTSIVGHVAAGGGFSVSYLVDAFGLAITAAGGYSIIRKLIWSSAPSVIVPPPPPPGR